MADLSEHQQPSAFERLPAELRNRIYHLALVEDEPIEVTDNFGLILKPYAPSHQPALTRTSRQIRSETLPIYYGENAFLMGAGEADIYFATFFQWTYPIEHHMKLIRMVGTCWHVGSPPQQQFAYLTAMVGEGGHGVVVGKRGVAEEKWCTCTVSHLRVPEEQDDDAERLEALLTACSKDLIASSERHEGGAAPCMACR